MAKSAVKRSDGEAWFAGEKHGHEVYHAKVGSGTIVVTIGNVAKVPIKSAAQRHEHISKVVAENVERFFLSKYAVDTICNAFNSMPSKMNTRKCAEWIESQKGRHPREVMLEARRRFAGVVEEFLFRQFETAVGRQVRLSPQEWDAARKLSNGMSQKQIASEMKTVAKNNYLRRKGENKSCLTMTSPNAGAEPDPSLSDETVRKHISAVRRKAGRNVNRLEAVLWFLGFEL